MLDWLFGRKKPEEEKKSQKPKTQNDVAIHLILEMDV